MSFDESGIWGVLVIVGPIVLALAIIWAMVRNKGNPHDIERTESATRKMYDEQSREDDANDAR
ncbi:hypothetical protein [Sphingomonas sp.]|uniref:hypothetical protein n=1 Tax=Sphingomonas sp. TaxID=28214 RepID=UPI002B86E02B|nr:hypothetical protein [Sphingomonas sp.]HTG37689.1 hypothetical protein [Sphingomonas sp.]